MSASVPPSDIETAMQCSSLMFSSSLCASKFCTRVGQLALTRDGASAVCTTGTTDTLITIDTPNIFVGTSRGIVPHFSRDHTNSADAIRWINVPFESFLEQTPPIPTLQGGPHPLHNFLGFDNHRHIVSLCLRDPLDVREMPPNGSTYVSANCIRGVKKVTLSDWHEYVHKMHPDVVFALTDTPFTPPPYSQKRVMKSIERSVAWVADILRPPPNEVDSSEPHTYRPSRHPLNVFVHMAGGTSLPAREAFAYGLRERLHGPEAEAVKPLRCLDEGITGYAFDLAVLRGIKPRPSSSQHQSLSDGYLQLERQEMLQHSRRIEDASTPNETDESTAGETLEATKLDSHLVPDIASLLKASLGELSEKKPRLVTGTRSPHEMLRLIRDVGIDLFDVAWATNAASLGIALDFVFPVPTNDASGACQSLGHNLYDPVYARQFVRFADTLTGAGEDQSAVASQQRVCLCIACSPHTPSPILHSAIDHQSRANLGGQKTPRYEKPYSRAYVHHLLHTHEMSAHALLVAHNIAVVSAFLAGVRQVCTKSRSENRTSQFTLEVERFNSVYDDSEELFVAARKDWECIDKARGKGRLAREKEK